MENIWQYIAIELGNKASAERVILNVMKRLRRFSMPQSNHK